jgi:hypothetical protein
VCGKKYLVRVLRVVIVRRTVSCKTLKLEKLETHKTKITSCMEGWTKRAPVAQTLQSVRQTCPCTTATCPCTLIRFSLNSRVKPTPTSPVNNKLKHQVTAPVKPTERKLRVAWRAGRNAYPSHKRCIACAKHAHAPPPRARAH